MTGNGDYPGAVAFVAVRGFGRHEVRVALPCCGNGGLGCAWFHPVASFPEHGDAMRFADEINRASGRKTIRQTPRTLITSGAAAISARRCGAPRRH